MSPSTASPLSHPAPRLLEQVITDPELCSLIRVNKQTTFVWRRDAGLPYFRLGIGRGSIRYRRDEVEEWILARRQAPCPPRPRRQQTKRATAR